MLSRMARIAIVGGGSIGEALLSGLLRAGRQVKDLVVAEKDPNRAKYLSEKYSVLVTTVADAVDTATYVIVAVTPFDVEGLVNEIAAAAAKSESDTEVEALRHAGAVGARTVPADLAAGVGRQPDAEIGAQRARRRTARCANLVVHPPFRWQRRDAEGFSQQVADLEASSDVMVAVENMFPFRTDPFFGAGQTSIERMRKRGGKPGPGISAFAPSYDPLDGDHAHYTLDLSHTATAGTDAVDMARRMGDGLVHLHLCDGSGASTDEHLVPGYGTQPTVEICEMLAAGSFSGHVILEVTEWVGPFTGLQSPHGAVMISG